MGNDKLQDTLDGFAHAVYEKLCATEKNLIFSPFSIHTCGAMLWLGADGETAMELCNGLGFHTSQESQVAACYHGVLAEYERSSVLKMASKIYVMKGCTISSTYDTLVKQKFLSGIEEADFSKSANAAKQINDWVSKQTNNLIRSIVPSAALNADTRMVLVNAIHFRGVWAKQFPKADTRNDNFFLSETHAVQIEMMHVHRKSFLFAGLPELDASALQMPYKECDLFMLILLPNRVTGLETLVEKLRTTRLSGIPSKMKETQVDVKFPKFKAEFSVELKKTFNELGMRRMFTSAAEFPKMLSAHAQLQVSAILHKAYIDVTEEGTEAAAATAAIVMARSMPAGPPPPKLFHVDHPFYYAILNKNGHQFFAGSFREPTK